MQLDSDTAFFSAQGAECPQWHWYAIADSAQSRHLPAALLDGSTQARCLLGASQGSPLAAQSPHLVSLCAPHSSSPAWKWIDLHARRGPYVTVIASQVGFDELFLHLRQFSEVRLPDGERMFFAFWDPAILGTLVGQTDDSTLHVRGPVLSEVQRGAVFKQVEGWWYWDRDGVRHRCAKQARQISDVELPLNLAQAQVDELVEASVPDHVLYYLDLNQPLLLDEVAKPRRYAFVSSAIQQGREIGLEGMKDLVNYVCAALIYKERMHCEDTIRKLLQSVKEGSLSFSKALEEFP